MYTYLDFSLNLTITLLGNSNTNFKENEFLPIAMARMYLNKSKKLMRVGYKMIPMILEWIEK